VRRKGKKQTGEIKDFNFLAFFDESGKELHVDIGESISCKFDGLIVQPNGGL